MTCVCIAEYSEAYPVKESVLISNYFQSTTYVIFHTSTWNVTFQVQIY